MVFLVEDGTAMPDANSMASVAFSDTYHESIGNEEWAAFDTEKKQQLLVKASAYLCDDMKFPWVGTKVRYDQGMPWPRVEAYDRDGSAVPDNVVPPKVKQATAYLALIADSTELNPPQERGGMVKKEKVGPLETEYMDGAPAGTTFEEAFGLVSAYLEGSVTGRPGVQSAVAFNAPDSAPIFGVGMDDMAGNFNHGAEDSING